MAEGDEKITPGSTAVAEPPVETPPVETPEIPGEAVPAPEQEQPEGEKPEGVSETPEKEDEVPTLEQMREANLGQIKEWAESDPDAAKLLAERFGEKVEDVGEEKLAWERERGQAERLQRWNTALSTYQQHTPEAIETQLSNYLDRLNTNLLQAAQDLEKGVEGATAAGVQIDAAAIAKAITPLIRSGQDAAYNVVGASVNSTIVGALTSHAAYSHLTSEERTKFTEAVTSGKYDEAITLQLDAAIRAAPEEAKKTAKADADAAAELIEKATNFKLGLGKKGATGGGAPSKHKETKDMTADELAARTPEEIDADTARWLAENR